MKLTILVLMLISSISVADSWRYEDEISESQYIFGDVTIKKIVDGTKNQTYPKFTVEVYDKKELKGLYAGVSFQDIEVSPDGRIFVAISNDGLPGSAILIFNNDGELIILVPHSFDAIPLNYCSKSATRVRLWYDEDSPDINFSEGGSVITVMGCDGKKINITEMLK